MTTGREVGPFFKARIGGPPGRMICAAIAADPRDVARETGPTSRPFPGPWPYAPYKQGHPRGRPWQVLELGRVEGVPEAGRRFGPMTSRESGLVLLPVLGLLLGRTIHSASAGVRPAFAPRPGPSSRDHLDPHPGRPSSGATPRVAPAGARVGARPRGSRGGAYAPARGDRQSQKSHSRATPGPPPAPPPLHRWLHPWPGGGRGGFSGRRASRRRSPPSARAVGGAPYLLRTRRVMFSLARVMLALATCALAGRVQASAGTKHFVRTPPNGGPGRGALRARGHGAVSTGCVDRV